MITKQPMKAAGMLVKKMYIALLIVIFSLAGACTIDNSSAENAAIENTGQVVSSQLTDTYSFTISCGSGCAMTYNGKNPVLKNHGYKVQFGVIQYINEAVAEEYEETYLFSCDGQGSLKSIQVEGVPENILDQEDLYLRDELKIIGHALCAQ